MFTNHAVLFLLVAPAVILASPFSSCESMPVNVTLPNCNNDVCEVRRDRPVIVEITLKARKPISRIHGTVHIFYRHLWWQVNIGDQANICDHLIAGRCPLATDAQATFRGQLSIPKSVRIGQKSTVKIRGIDQDKRVVVCVKILGKVVA